jgi:ASC-1-like (ASCH) protein
MIHVAVLLKPYLELILQGKKLVECRLTKDARDPYENIEAGERIYFKLSAGPYAATAIADHVMFESGLSPRRVNEIRRDYNDLICGEKQYWDWKREARFCTLIWLKDIAPVNTGPSIRPLQGVAWLTLEEEPVWRRVEAAHSPKHQLFDGEHHSRAGAFMIEVTEGNIRNNSLYVTKVADRFPKLSFGGKSKADIADQLTLVLHNGPTVQSDIVGPRKMLRTRVWGAWFRKHGVRPGDHVVFTRVDERTYFVGLTRQEKKN